MDPSRLEYLFKRYMEKSYSPEEKEELMQMIGDPVNSTLIDNISNKYGPSHHRTPPLDKQTADQILNNILTAGRQRYKVAVVRKMRFNKLQWLKYAAIILLLLGGSVYFWNNERASRNHHVAPPTGNDIRPGGNRAIIVLSDESVINVDSLPAGASILNGNTRIIKADGEILYEPAGAQSASASFLNTMQTPIGGQYHLVLSDGTQVWLNAQSSITYPVVFNGAEREVSIQGEAYLEVAKNKSQPFKVKVDDRLIIDVLGTSFNVNAYTNEKNVVATLLQGSIKVNSGLQSSVLVPGQAAAVNYNKINVTQNPNAENAISWKNGFFQFQQADIHTVMRQLARWYEVKVEFEGKPPHVQITGRIDRSLFLSEILEILAKMDVKATISGNTLRVYNK